MGATDREMELLERPNRLHGESQSDQTAALVCSNRMSQMALLLLLWLVLFDVQYIACTYAASGFDEEWPLSPPWEDAPSRLSLWDSLDTLPTELAPKRVH